MSPFRFWKLLPLFVSIVLGSVSSTTFGQKSSDEIKILFLGDSLTAGYGVEKSLAYPALVEDSLKKELPNRKITVVNGGISGSTSQSGLSRLKWQLKAKPTHLFLALGANDGLRGQPVENLKKNLDEIIILSKENKITVLLAGMKVPPNYGKKYTEEFEGAYKKLAKRHQIAFLPFLLEGVAGNPKLNQADGIHPNEKGHAILAEHVKIFIRKQIQ